MNLEQQIQEAIKEAMKAKDAVAMNATRAIKGEILLFKTAEGGSKEVSDGDILKMIQKLVKQRKEAAEQYVAAGRKDLADNVRTMIHSWPTAITTSMWQHRL